MLSDWKTFRPKKTPAAPASTAPRKPGRQVGDHRAAPGAWKRVFRQLVDQDKFNYDNVVEAAGTAAIDTTKPSARVRVSRMKEGVTSSPSRMACFA